MRLRFEIASGLETALARETLTAPEPEAATAEAGTTLK